MRPKEFENKGWRGVTGTSCYRFEYNLYLIKIPSHINREIIYRKGARHICRLQHVFFFGAIGIYHLAVVYDVSEL